MRGFQSGNRLFSRHRWKSVQELVEAVIARQIVDEVPEWHAGADENGRAPQDLGVAVNDGHAGRHAKPLRESYATGLRIKTIAFAHSRLLANGRAPLDTYAASAR